MGLWIINENEAGLYYLYLIDSERFYMMRLPEYGEIIPIWRVTGETNLALTIF